MVDRKLSELDEVTALTVLDEVYVNDDGVSKRITRDNLATSLGVSDGVTDLAYDAPTKVISSSTGTGATLTVVDGSNDGLMTVADKTKLDGLNAVPTEVAGTADTLTATDNGQTIRYVNAALTTVTIPTDAAEDLVDGFWCLLFAEGAGGLTLATSGVTLAGSSPFTTIAQNEGLMVIKTAVADTWLVLGGTSA